MMTVFFLLSGTVQMIPDIVFRLFDQISIGSNRVATVLEIREIRGNSGKVKKD